MQKSRLISILCLLLVSLAATAQNRSANNASVRGVVLEQGTNVPVEFAVVILSPSQQHTTTDKEGRFEFKQVEPGPSTLTIQFVGMETLEQNIEVAAGQIGSTPTPDNQKFQYTIKTLGRLSTVEEFEDVVLKAAPNGQILRL